MSSCENVLTYSKNLVDECEAVFVKRDITTIRITDSKIVEIKQNHEETLGIRIIHKKKIVSAQTKIVEDYKDVINNAIGSMSFLNPKKFWGGLPSGSKRTSDISLTFDKKLKEITGKQAADISQDMINSSLDEKISAISGSLNIVSEEFQIRNSSGVDEKEFATYISGMINADSSFGSFPVSGIGQMSGRTLDKFSAEKIGEDAKKMCVDSINPKKCEADEYSVIFEPYSVGEILAYVFAANFNLKIYQEKKSCFSEMLEKSIAVNEFSLIDDPHAPNGIGSKKFDDEGVPTSIRPLIENGIFKNTFMDCFTAYKEENVTSGNASRPGLPMGRDAESIPIPAPHNLRVKKGETSQEEMISDTKHGLLVGRLWYTYAVNPIKGDFSCTARSGIRVIEGGEIKYPAKPVRIIHNLPTMLCSISGIGNNDRNVLQWASLPSITPSIRVENIKVTPIE